MQTSSKFMALRRTLRRNARQVLLDTCIAGRRHSGGTRPAPDFVIVGAQRCGTTSLFRALSEHPAVMPNVLNAKGIHYFDTSYHQNEAWYFSHFASQAERDARSGKVGQRARVGEASPYYLFHPAGAERMAATIPDAKLIVLLRDPVKRAISHHLHMVWEGHEPVKDLDEALDLEVSRLQGIEPKLLADRSLVSRPHQHYSYMARGHYAEQLERLFTFFDRENVMVMAAETLVSDSSAVLSKVQSFIGLEPDASIALEKRNASSSFEPRAETVKRLREEFVESDQRLRALLDIDIPWVDK